MNIIIYIKSLKRLLLVVAAMTAFISVSTSYAGDRLLATGGVTQMEGAGGVA